jgi:hypothetical protein
MLAEAKPCTNDFFPNSANYHYIKKKKLHDISKAERASNRRATKARPIPFHVARKFSATDRYSRHLQEEERIAGLP